MLAKTATDRLHNYVVLSLHTGGWTEELQALRWEHVHLEARTDVVGHATREIAERLDMDEEVVGRWRRRFHAERLADRLLRFGEQYRPIARPFDWTFTGADLERVLA